MRTVFMALLVLFLPAMALFGEGTAPDSADPKYEVAFLIGDSHCGGMLSAQWIITARHCVDAMVKVLSEGGRIEARYAGESYVYKPSELALLRASAPPNAAGEALSLDFALLPAPRPWIGRAAPPDPTPPSALRVSKVGFRRPDGGYRTCSVSAVCGAEIEIACEPGALPQRGTSGHILYQLPSKRPVAILTHNSAAGTAVATSYATIMGRSSSLASAWNALRQKPKFECDPRRSDARYCALSNEFARSAAYRYPMDRGGSCRAAAMPKSALSYSRIESSGFFVAAGLVSDGVVALADRTTSSLCVWRRGSRAVTECSRLPAAFGRNVRAILPVGGGDFIVTQSTVIEKAKSKALKARYDVATGEIVYGRTLVAPISQIVAAAKASSGSIVLGGTGGVCMLGSDGCDRIARSLNGPADTNWIVRGFLKLPIGDLLAVGRDHRDVAQLVDLERKHVPMAGCWTIGDGEGALNIKQQCRFPKYSFIERLTQLVSPVLVGSEPIAFSSSGEAVSLLDNRIGSTIPFANLMSSDRPAAAIDDAVRAAYVADEDHVVVASSDGSVRVLTVERGPEGKVMRFIARDDLTAFDIGIWVTDLVSGPNWAVAITQSGDAYAIKW